VTRKELRARVFPSRESVRLLEPGVAGRRLAVGAAIAFIALSARSGR